MKTNDDKSDSDFLCWRILWKLLSAYSNSSWLISSTRRARAIKGPSSGVELKARIEFIEYDSKSSGSQRVKEFALSFPVTI